MASLIEHKSKEHAYMKCKVWGEQSAVWYANENMSKHQKYLNYMNERRSYYYGSPPRSVFLNWFAHKLLEFCWREKYLTPPTEKGREE